MTMNIPHPEPLSSESAGYYVYVYKNVKGKVRYVGYGKGLDRPVSRDRSGPMLQFLSEGKFTIEIAGPYGSKETGLAVETALISLLRPDLNSSRAPGPGRLRFRPFGVPEAFAERLAAPPLSDTDLKTISGGQACPFLFVRISDQNFEGSDARKGYTLNKPLPDRDILERIDKWWQIGRYVEQWRLHPQQSPGTLVAVVGPPTHRIIIGAVHVDRSSWSAAHPIKGGLYRVPVIETPDLDAHHLRGRLLAPNSDIKFGAITSQFFVLLNCDGTLSGGNQSRR